METQKSSPYTVRLKSDTKSRIQELLSSFENANDAYEYIIKILELSKSKESLPGQSTNISNFEFYSQKMISLYVNSVESQIAAEEIAKDKFEKEIEILKANNNDFTKTIAELEYDKSQLADKIFELESENNNMKLKLNEKINFSILAEKVQELLEYDKSLNNTNNGQNSVERKDN